MSNNQNHQKMFPKEFNVNERGLNKFGKLFIISANGADIVAGIEESGNIGIRCASHSLDLVWMKF